eukprot:gene5950-6640_t
MAGLDIKPSDIPVRIVGCGTFAEIVVLRKKEDSSQVTWKAIDLGDCSEDDKEHALREVERLSKLKHVNIVAYLNPFIDDTNLCYEMEYTDDGTLYQKIMSRRSLFSEPTVLWYMYQLLSALEYAHGRKILHRNINTLNIYLSKNHILKLGCFGVQKVLSNTVKSNVESTGGIPYYLSPEVAEKREKYSSKSDVWACGCVLYEMLTLVHVFDAEDLVALTVAVTLSSYNAVPRDYTDGVRALLESMLSTETERRPTAAELVANSIFTETKSKFDQIVRDLKLVADEDEEDGGASGSGDGAEENSNGAKNKPDVPVLFSSQIGEVFCWGGTKPLPQKIDDFSVSNPAFEVATGRKHFAVVNESGDLFTWADILQDKDEDEATNDANNGDNEVGKAAGPTIRGQLGHGDTSLYIYPKKVEFFTGIPVQRVSCGEDFTAILDKDGILYMTGSDRHGCIGCDRTLGNEVLLPRKVDHFDNLKVLQVDCGDAHVVALADDGEVYTWGCGQYGRLGLGTEDDSAVPEQMPLPPNCSNIIAIKCGLDNTLILTGHGHVVGCGSNEFNKMAFSNRVATHGGRAMKTTKKRDFRTSPLPIRALKTFKIVAVDAGRSHSAAIDADGRVITFGNNAFGQLGSGDFREKGAAVVVKGPLQGKECRRIGCGDGFTLAATADSVYAWGLGRDGRLGIDPSLLGEKGCCSIPRRVFSSLIKVTSLACQQMHVILLGQQVYSLSTDSTDSSSEENKEKVTIQKLGTENSRLESVIAEQKQRIRVLEEENSKMRPKHSTPER